MKRLGMFLATGLGLCFLSSATCSVTAFAGASIQDPKDIIGLSDQFVAAGSFEQAFQVGDQSVAANTECSFECESETSCKKVCSDPVVTETTVLAVDAEAVTLKVRNLGSGDEGQEQLPRAEFDRLKGNWLRIMLEALSQRMAARGLGPLSDRDFIELTESQLVEHVLPSGQKIETLKINLVMNSYMRELDSYMQLPMHVMLGKSMPALGQFLEFRFFPELAGEAEYRLISIKR